MSRVRRQSAKPKLHILAAPRQLQRLELPASLAPLREMGPPREVRWRRSCRIAVRSSQTEMPAVATSGSTPMRMSATPIASSSRLAAESVLFAAPRSCAAGMGRRCHRDRYAVARGRTCVEALTIYSCTGTCSPSHGCQMLVMSHNRCVVVSRRLPAPRGSRSSRRVGRSGGRGRAAD